MAALVLKDDFCISALCTAGINMIIYKYPFNERDLLFNMCMQSGKTGRYFNVHMVSG